MIIDNEQLTTIEQMSTVNCQLSTLNSQLSTVNCQLSTVNYFKPLDNHTSTIRLSLLSGFLEKRYLVQKEIHKNLHL
ncbi:MAG: hypothetical protein HC786_17145 [Richelia sp. CSU_2_1]|nr:hypothetical protein [Microcoleus sp. SM1_3_4]NJR23752.1 hypothetical protein [Richelia sp. CSU_2_1]